MSLDRLAIRMPPRAAPAMHQTWAKLLFLHWPVDAASIRGLVPPPLEVDTFDGSAWITVAPFTMMGIRPSFLPSIPVVGESHELNVRTYVHYQGVPGVWFFSLDANNPLAVVAARLGFNLPYYRARMSLLEDGSRITFSSERAEGPDPAPRFVASWTRGRDLPSPTEETLDFFLVERYCLYAIHRGRVRRTRIHHRPWELREAWLRSIESNLFATQGLPLPKGDPLLHAQGPPLDVEIWLPETVS